MAKDMLKKMEERHNKQDKQLADFWKRHKEFADAKNIKEVEKCVNNEIRGLFKKDETVDFERALLTAILSVQVRANCKSIAIKEGTKPLVSGFLHKAGIPVTIRPCGDEYKNKTYFGIYIGDMALGFGGAFKDEQLEVYFSGHNPAIFVPALKKVFFGCESWWGEIKDEKDLDKVITDEDIENVWYVKALKEMYGKKPKEGSDA